MKIRKTHFILQSFNFRIWPPLKKDIYGIFDVLNKDFGYKSKMNGVILRKASVLNLQKVL